jgi:hypothetical protein
MNLTKQASDPVDFIWPVPSSGFRWIKAEILQRSQDTLGLRKEKWYLVAIGLDHRGEVPSANVYRPLESHTGLFRTFAETEISKKAILGFANQYGALGGDCLVEVSLKSDARDSILKYGNWTYGNFRLGDRLARAAGNIPEGTRFEGVGGPEPTRLSLNGEPFQEWVSEILTMREMLWLWEALQQKRVSDLGDVIKWEVIRSTPRAYYQHKRSAGDVYSSGETKKSWIGHDPSLWPLLKPDDVVTSGWFYLQQIIDAKLVKHLSSTRLLWDRQKTLRLTIVPDSLISALWLQFARAIDRDRSYRTCEHCGKWIEVGAEARADAKYCSNACRQKAYWRRRNDSSV